MGIEPTFTAWEAVVLPLDDTRQGASKCIILPMIQVVVNGAARRFERPLAVTELVEKMSLAGKRIAAEKNGGIVPHASTLVDDGDRLEIVVAGRYRTLRPPITLSRMAMTAKIRRTWMTPPIVLDVTRPRTQRMAKTTASV